MNFSFAFNDPDHSNRILRIVALEQQKHTHNQTHIHKHNHKQNTAHTHTHTPFVNESERRSNTTVITPKNGKQDEISEKCQTQCQSRHSQLSAHAHAPVTPSGATVNVNSHNITTIPIVSNVNDNDIQNTQQHHMMQHQHQHQASQHQHQHHDLVNEMTVSMEGAQQLEEEDSKRKDEIGEVKHCRNSVCVSSMATGGVSMCAASPSFSSPSRSLSALSALGKRKRHSTQGQLTEDSEQHRLVDGLTLSSPCKLHKPHSTDIVIGAESPSSSGSANANVNANGVCGAIGARHVFFLLHVNTLPLTSNSEFFRTLFASAMYKQRANTDIEVFATNEEEAQALYVLIKSLYTSELFDVPSNDEGEEDETDWTEAREGLAIGMKEGNTEEFAEDNSSAMMNSSNSVQIATVPYITHSAATVPSSATSLPTPANSAMSMHNSSASSFSALSSLPGSASSLHSTLSEPTMSLLSSAASTAAAFSFSHSHSHSHSDSSSSTSSLDSSFSSSTNVSTSASVSLSSFSSLSYSALSAAAASSSLICADADLDECEDEDWAVSRSQSGLGPNNGSNSDFEFESVNCSSSTSKHMNLGLALSSPNLAATSSTMQLNRQQSSFDLSSATSTSSSLSASPASTSASASANVSASALSSSSSCSSSSFSSCTAGVSVSDCGGDSFDFCCGDLSITVKDSLVRSLNVRQILRLLGFADEYQSTAILSVVIEPIRFILRRSPFFINELLKLPEHLFQSRQGAMLRSALDNFIDRQFRVFYRDLFDKQSLFLSLPAAAVARLLECDSLIVDGESTVAYAVRLWMNARWKEAGGLTSAQAAKVMNDPLVVASHEKIIHQVRFFTISPRYLLNAVLLWLDAGPWKHLQSCRPLVYSGIRFGYDAELCACHEQQRRESCFCQHFTAPKRVRTLPLNPASLRSFHLTFDDLDKKDIRNSDSGGLDETKLIAPKVCPAVCRFKGYEFKWTVSQNLSTDDHKGIWLWCALAGENDLLYRHSSIFLSLEVQFWDYEKSAFDAEIKKKFHSLLSTEFRSFWSPSWPQLNDTRYVKNGQMKLLVEIYIMKKEMKDQLFR